MPSLAKHQSNEFAKVLTIGDSKSGKTGSLVSLVKAGYKLRILDTDNLLDVLKGYILEECPDLIDNVESRTIRDKRKATPLGSVIDGQPKAFIDALKMLDYWKYTDDDGTVIDLGKPCDWGPDCILVVDSLSRLCDSAYDFREPLAPTGKDGKADGRMIYFDAQNASEDVLSTLTGKSFRTNVLVIAHVFYMEMPDGTKKGFPQGIGSALSPKIPQYFPTTILYTKKGEKRTLQTTSTALIDLANPKPFEMEKSYPIETGLAQIFEVLRGPLKKEGPKLVRKA